MRPQKRWIVAQPGVTPARGSAPAPPPHAGGRGAGQIDSLPPLVQQLLINRGITDPADAAAFLDPKLSDLPAPERLGGCIEAAGRIVAAIRDGRKIAIYGDYDVDGTTGSAILWHAIKLAGGDVSYYVPHRLEEGYGLNAEALASLAAKGAKMVITVDCGITAVNEAQVARALGIELIVTDHHEPVGELPAAACIVHPRIGGDYPNPRLCGSGVAMKLAWAIGQTLSAAIKVSEPFRKFLLQAISLAALGTVADVVPLIGENRVLVVFGLRSIKQTGLAGLDALIDSAGLRAEKVDAYHVGFTLAPRLNAAGRMDQAQQVVEMFTEADPARSRELANFLHQQNQKRQATERAILHQAIQLIEADPGFAARRSIVLAGDWHPGVVGIVASRLVDRYNRPTVLIGVQNGVGHGSARSIQLLESTAPNGQQAASSTSDGPRFSLNDALAACGEHLLSFGGHAMAGGLRLASDRVARFAAAFEEYTRSRLSDQDIQPTLRIDAEATPDDLKIDVVRKIQALAPFGQGNPTPVLVARDCRLAGAAEPRRVGRDGSHLQFHVRFGERVFKAIAFNRADWARPLAAGKPFDLAFEPGINTYQGQSSVEMTVRDVRWGSSG